MKYDSQRKCPKCLADASTRYRGGRLLRRCLRCGYEWTEEPLDTLEVKDENSP